MPAAQKVILHDTHGALLMFYEIVMRILNYPALIVWIRAEN